MSSSWKATLRKPIQVCWMLFVFHSPVLKSNLEKGFEAYQAKNYQSSYVYFQKSKDNFPCLSAYGLSLIHSNRESGRYSLDSAYIQIGSALIHWPAMGSREAALGVKLQVTRQTLEHHNETLESEAFNAALESGSIPMLDHFIEFYVGTSFVPGAIRARDSIAYSIAMGSGTAADMLNYINKYPGSESYVAAKRTYQKLLYKESVSDGELSSYEMFIRSFPLSPHVHDAWWNVFRLNTKYSVDPKSYYDFIRKYPGSPLEEEAWFRVYEFHAKSNPASGYEALKSSFPEFPDSIIQSFEVMDESRVLLPFFQSGMFGFMDSLGTVVVDPIYESASFFAHGLAKVRLNGLHGFVNSKGQLVIPNQHAAAADFSDGFAVVSDNGSMGVIDTRGNTVVPVAYDSVTVAGENLFAYHEGGNCGFVARDGYPVTPPRLLDCGYFRDGVAIVRELDGFALLDKSGKLLAQGFDSIHYLGSGRYAVLNDQGFALYDSQGMPLTKHVFDGLGFFSEGLAPAAVAGKVGFIDVSGKTRIPFIFRHRDGFPSNTTFTQGLVAVSLVEAVGVADNQGNILIADAFEDVVLLGSGVAAVYENGVCRLMEVSTERFLTDVEFDSTGRITDGFLPVKGAGGWGLLDTAWKTVVPLQYERVQTISSNYHVVGVDGKYGVVNNSGDTVVDIIYDSATLLHGRFLALGFVGKVEWFDTVSGNILIPHKE